MKELGLNSINEKAAVLHRHGGARALEKERGKTPNGHAAAVRGGYQVVMVAVVVCVCVLHQHMIAQGRQSKPHHGKAVRRSRDGSHGHRWGHERGRTSQQAHYHGEDAREHDVGVCRVERGR